MANLQEAMKRSDFNSAATRDVAGSLIVDGRCAQDGDFWTIREHRITNRHYRSLDALIDAEVSSDQDFSPHEFY